MSTTPDSEATTPRPKERYPESVPSPGCTKRGCAIFLVLPLIAVVAMVLVAKNAREKARASAFSNTMKIVGLLIQNEANAHKHLPRPFRYPDLAGEGEEQVYFDEIIKDYKFPLSKKETAWFKPGEPYLGHRIAKEPDINAKPLLSWRVTMHTYGCNDEWDGHYPGMPYPRFWEPWNSEANSLVGKDPRFGFYILDVPGDKDENLKFNTPIVAIVGPDTAFGDGKTKPASYKEYDPDMILAVESRNSGIHWMEPRDFDIRTMPRTINAPDGSGISGHTSRGFHVIFADGELWRIKHTVPFEELEKFFTLTSAKKYDREKVLGPYVDRKF
ncbi:MAG: hypothetical protein PVH19_13620 [Planctomycetia bacterium]|jgi:hypothetical protein